jgi:hypothetical protein
MVDFILLMHDDGGQAEPSGWEPYFARLRASGAFDGGSAIGEGQAWRKQGPPGAVGHHLSGFIRLRAESLQSARQWLEGNPVYEAGGTVEIRELPRG